MTAPGKVLGYALIQLDAHGQPHMDFYGRLFASPEEAREHPESDVSDQVVAVCEPAVIEQIVAVLALHYPALSDAERTPLCPDCKGAPGHHPCGCWSPAEGVQPVCGHCHTGGYRSSSVPWPCPTARAVGAVPIREVTP